MYRDRFCFLRRNGSISFSFHLEFSFFHHPLIYLSLSFSVLSRSVCGRPTFLRHILATRCRCHLPLFFRDQTLLLKPLFPPSVALTSTFFSRADTYEQSDVLTRMALKKERGVERWILIRGDENGNMSEAEGAGIHEPSCLSLDI